jgi:hypothetical protein
VHLSVGRGIALDNADFSWFVLLMPTAAPALAALDRALGGAPGAPSPPDAPAALRR